MSEQPTQTPDPQQEESTQPSDPNDSPFSVPPLDVEEKGKQPRERR